MSRSNSNSTNHHHHSRDYARVATTPDGSTTTTSFETTQQQPPPSLSASSSAAADTTTVPPRRTTTEQITDKCVAVIWVVVAALVFHYTNSAHVYSLTTTTTPTTTPNDTPNATTTGSANVILLQLVAIGLGINTVLFLYLLLYLPYVKGLPCDSSAWEVYCPRVIPTMTLVGLCVAIVLIRATYPVWGFLAPLIIGIEALGVLYATHFIPVGWV